MKLKLFFLYIIIFFTVSIVFTIVLFPANKFITYLTQSAETNIPADEVNLKKIVLSPPFGIKITDLNIIFSKETQCTLDTLNLQLEPISLIIEALPFLNNADPKYSSYKGKINIEAFSLKLNSSIHDLLNLQAIDFSDIEIEFTRNANILKIIRCRAKGRMINMELIGEINIMSPFQDSKLELMCRILSSSLYLQTASTILPDSSKEGVKIKLTGTLRNPKVGI